ncbi:TetR family transcriptional regulator [Enterovirga sp.]|uniref:TetR family transcriptional regulator n=1 Tax=Enterovirga sp. TaxID=2026350 RepID=UPI002CF75B4F|nr:TetR family transcriptional regulator [Enterovirga sp.]HMO27753.1 TetR family transcriptional regulator [Enterovirga sp.]
MNDIATGRRGERRQRLLEAASRVFACIGCTQATMDEIAAEAGLRKAAGTA